MFIAREDKTAWERFFETGKVEDYLSYCQQRGQPGGSLEKAVPFRAADNGGDRPAELSLR